MSAPLIANLGFFLGFLQSLKVELTKDHVCMGVNVTKRLLFYLLLLTSIYVTFLEPFRLIRCLYLSIVALQYVFYLPLWF